MSLHIQITLLSAFAILLVIAVFFLYKNGIRNKQSYILLENQKEEIILKSEELDAINEQLLAQANYLEATNQEMDAMNQSLQELLEKNQYQTHSLGMHQEEIQSQNEELLTQQEELNRKNEDMNYALRKLKRTQSQLVQSEKLASLGQLTAGIAHEINNPINYINSGIIGLRSVLDDFKVIISEYDKLSKGNAENQLNKIKELKLELEYEDLLEGIDQLTENIMIGAVRTTNIVNGLKVFSHQDGMEPQPMELHKNIESTLMLLHHQYKNRIEIVRNYGNLPTVDGFGGEINQVLMNVLGNAIQAIEADGEITITTQFIEDMSTESILAEVNPEKILKEPFVKISIQDSGEGVDNGIFHKLYDPFFTTKEVGKGTGLGLSISLSIVKRHRGFMLIKNNEATGAVVTIWLPVSQLNKS